jgi:hypothetical protein
MKSNNYSYTVGYLDAVLYNLRNYSLHQFSEAVRRDFISMYRMGGEL